MFGRIKKETAQACIQMYEKKELILEMDELYHYKKTQLLDNKFIRIEDLKGFIETTRRTPDTCLYEDQEKEEPSPLICDIKYGKVLYYKFHIFNRYTIKRIVTHLQANRSRDYLILDLRDNKGGSVEACFELLNNLSRNCELFTLRFKNKKEVYYSDNKCINFKKIYVLVNENTSHASEILAQSLVHNSDNITIVGGRTSGYKMGHEDFVLKDYEIKLKLSSYSWHVNDDFYFNARNESIKSLDDVYKEILSL